MAITWFADVLRAAGLTVVEHAGWKTRTVGGSWTPTFGIVHATAAPDSQSDTTQIRIVRDGREGLDGPIANACVDRAGRWHVLAAGRCNTTIAGTAGPYVGKGNTYALGVEACNDNLGGPWPDVQYRAYVAGWAAIARKLGWGPERLRGHKEHTPGHKTDPTFDMAGFRANVARVLAGEDDADVLTDQQAQQLRDSHFTLAKAINNPTGAGTVPLHVWAEWMTVMVKTLAVDGGVDPDDLERIEAAARAGAAEGVAAAADSLAAAIVARLPETGTLTIGAVEVAVKEGVRAVLGSLDEQA